MEWHEKVGILLWYLADEWWERLDARLETRDASEKRKTIRQDRKGDI